MVLVKAYKGKSCAVSREEQRDRGAYLKKIFHRQDAAGFALVRPCCRWV